MGFIFPYLVNFVYGEEAIKTGLDLFILLWPMIYFIGAGFTGDVLLILSTIFYIAIYFFIILFMPKYLNFKLNKNE